MATSAPERISRSVNNGSGRPPRGGSRAGFHGDGGRLVVEQEARDVDSCTAVSVIAMVALKWPGEDGLR